VQGGRRSLNFNAHIIETGTDSWRFKKSLERHQAEGEAKAHQGRVTLNPS
jgi:hypothetical protein